MASKNVIVMFFRDRVTPGVQKMARNSGKHLKALQKRFIAVTKAIRPFFAAVTGIGALAGGVFILGKAFKIAMENAIEQIDASAKLEGILQTTGNAAGITAGQMGEMANQMASVTTFSRTAITNAQALGATFTKIGGEIFPRAIHSALDMSAVFGQTLQQSMIQLGTALNDPIRGVGRLMRIGVSFNLTQKKMIEDFVMMGDVASAQNVIIEELETEFGQAAESLANTFVGAVRQSSAAIADFTGNIGLLISQIPRLLKGVQETRDTIVAFTTGDLVQLANAMFAFFIKVGGGFLEFTNMIKDSFLVQLIGWLVASIMGVIGLVIEGSTQIIIMAATSVVDFLHFIVGTFEDFYLGVFVHLQNHLKGFVNFFIRAINGIGSQIAHIPGVEFKQLQEIAFGDISGAKRTTDQRDKNRFDATATFMEMSDIIAGTFGKGMFDEITSFFGTFEDNSQATLDFYERMLEDQDELLAVLLAGEALDDDQKKLLADIKDILDGPRFQTLGLIAGFFSRLEAAVGDLNAFFTDIGIGLAQDESQTEKLGKAFSDMVGKEVAGLVGGAVQDSIRDFVTKNISEELLGKAGTSADEISGKMSSAFGALAGGFVGFTLFDKLFKKDTPTPEKPVPVKVVNWGDMTQELLKASARRAVSPMIASPGNSMMSSDFSRDTRF